jgi:hypothetical protein
MARRKQPAISDEPPEQQKDESGFADRHKRESSAFSGVTKLPRSKARPLFLCNSSAVILL